MKKAEDNKAYYLEILSQILASKRVTIKGGLRVYQISIENGALSELSEEDLNFLFLDSHGLSDSGVQVRGRLIKNNSEINYINHVLKRLDAFDTTIMGNKIIVISGSNKALNNVLKRKGFEAVAA